MAIGLGQDLLVRKLTVLIEMHGAITLATNGWSYCGVALKVDER